MRYESVIHTPVMPAVFVAAHRIQRTRAAPEPTKIQVYCALPYSLYTNKYNDGQRVGTWSCCRSAI
jgi:hypothetical protein